MKEKVKFGVWCILLATSGHIKDITHLSRKTVTLKKVVCETHVIIRIRSLCAGMRQTLSLLHIWKVRQNTYLKNKRIDRWLYNHNFTQKMKLAPFL